MDQCHSVNICIGCHYEEQPTTEWTQCEKMSRRRETIEQRIETGNEGIHNRYTASDRNASSQGIALQFSTKFACDQETLIVGYP